MNYQIKYTIILTLLSVSCNKEKATYNCVSGTCKEDTNGTYKDLASCQASCANQASDKYDCVSGKCEVSQNGQYSSLEACKQACISDSSYICMDGSCIYTEDGGPFKTLEECVLECEGVNSSCGTDSIVIGLGGEKYRIVQIGTQCWLAENLKYKPPYGPYQSNDAWKQSPFPPPIPKWCYNENDSSILYNSTAVDSLELCPKGWRIPKMHDWLLLINYLGGEQQAAPKLKATDVGFGSATNESGFTALPSGWRTDEFIQYGISSRWWTASFQNGGHLSILLTNKNSNVVFDAGGGGLSCRCVKE